MRMRFTGQYTNGRTSVSIDGVTFHGREPSEVLEGSRLLRHPEFETVRGRPRKDMSDGTILAD